MHEKITFCVPIFNVASRVKIVKCFLCRAEQTKLEKNMYVWDGWEIDGRKV